MSSVGQGTARTAPVFPSTETEATQLTRTPTVYVLRCIPARKAVLVSAVLLFVYSDLVCAAGWVIGNKLGDYLTDLQKIAIYFHVMNCVFLSGTSFLGIYAGAKSTKPKHSQLFAALLLGQILFGIASGVWCLHIMFTAGDLATKCTAMNQMGFFTGICRRLSLVKGLSVVAFTTLWILEIVTIYVANRFAKQLREEDLQKSLSSPTSPSY